MRELRKNRRPEEKILWQELRGGRLVVHFRRRQFIAGYIADLCCHKAGVVVELDGGGHQQQRGYDLVRNRAFAKRGIRILRFTSQKLRDDPRAVVTGIRAALT